MSTVDHDYQRVKGYHRSTTPINPDGRCLRMSAPCFIASKTNFLTGLDPNQGNTTGDIRRCALILFKLRTESKEYSFDEELSHREKSIFLLPSSSVTLMLCVCCAFCHLAAGPVVVVSSVGVSQLAVVRPWSLEL